MELSTAIIVIMAVGLAAAIVNGAMGHGFSTMTVPVALLFYTNRVLNPALVLLEIVINSAILLINRASVPKIWRRMIPIMLGLIPGIAIGSYLLATADSGVVKLATFLILLPLVLLQAAGLRRPIRSERLAGVGLGTGVGVIYSLTTISGPPLACMFTNQGFVQRDYRAALGMIRLTESVITATAYALLGLYSTSSTQILSFILPCVLIGIPIGALLIQRLNPERFRRFSISFNVWVIGFGLSLVLIQMGLVPSPQAFSILAAAILVDSFLLYRYFIIEAQNRGSSNPCTQETLQNLDVHVRGENGGIDPKVRKRQRNLIRTGGRTTE